MVETQTYSGKRVSLLKPDPMTIDIRDIACALSRINRFNGATSLPLNVAAHSLAVMRELERRKASPEVQLLGLLHDAHEAYIGDITNPVRRALKRYTPDDVISMIARDLDIAIFTGLGVKHIDLPENWTPVAQADRAVFAAEWRDLVGALCPEKITPSPLPTKTTPPDKAEEQFLAAYARLSLHCGPRHHATASDLIK